MMSCTYTLLAFDLDRGRSERDDMRAVTIHMVHTERTLVRGSRLNLNMRGSRLNLNMWHTSRGSSDENEDRGVCEHGQDRVDF